MTGGQDSRNRTVGTAQPEQYSRTGQSGQDSRNRKVGTGHSGQDNRDRLAVREQS
jgi:hypothetical protein